MYNQFFGFRERPFKLLPDPAYLFFGKSHEEAMAHLVYAVAQGDGFVKIVGDAGTGKTTICRSFIKKIKDEIEVAYIFNPKMNSIQLLKAINDEFEIDATADNIKDLIDTLNAFLMQIKAEKRKAILLIDEAQNLSAEILEQLRLISNLETNTDKLIQIILVGQPELDDMLASTHLRQLTQRITLNCYLQPLTHQETRAYVLHRTAIASQRQVAAFSPSAIATIYRYSRGIPRLINIAADRALLVAFSINRHYINARIARTAVRELTQKGYVTNHIYSPGSRPVWMFSLLLAALFIFILYHLKVFTVPVPSTVAVPEKTVPAAVTPDKVKIPPTNSGQSSPHPATRTYKIKLPPPGPKPTKSQPTFLQNSEVHLSKPEAIDAVLKLWGHHADALTDLEALGKEPDFFSRAAERYGFSYLSIRGDLELVKKLNLPVILECVLPGNEQPTFVVVRALGDETVKLAGKRSNAFFEIKIAELNRFWSDSGHLLWKNFRELTNSVPYRLTKDSILVLKAMLQELGFTDIRFSPYYDIETNEAIQQIQLRNGLDVDGIVGPQTMIVLYNEMNTYKIPHINSEEAGNAVE